MRMIDGDRLLRELTALSHGQVWPGWTYEGIRLLIERQPTLTSPNDWISVEDRLPEGNGEYIVTACDEGCPAGEGIWYDTVVVFAEYYDGCWTWNDGTEYDLTDIVTHWMPLPEPPDRRPPEGVK